MLATVVAIPSTLSTQTLTAAKNVDYPTWQVPATIVEVPPVWQVATTVDEVLPIMSNVDLDRKQEYDYSTWQVPAIVVVEVPHVWHVADTVVEVPSQKT